MAQFKLTQEELSMLSLISDDVKLKEAQVQSQIFSHVDLNEGIVFSSGAGAGKTYSLIETLKYIIKNRGRELRARNQNILCITYTNAAVNEINIRLGNTEIVKVSTIHECLWGLIQSQQSALLTIHIEEINTNIAEIIEKLSTSTEIENIKKYKSFRNLNSDMQEEFKHIMISMKDEFYQSYDKKSAVVNQIFGSKLEKFNILSNIANFRDIVSLVYKRDNLEKCLISIAESEDDFRCVKYHSRYNSDLLHRMLISHDTLLRYSYQLFGRYDLLKQMVIDKNPYILIDEFQDTDPLVVKLIKLLDDHAKKLNHPLFVGYFGDPVQNIYDSGVGSQISALHASLKPINKIYNRRSHQEIIDVINRIRNDDITQISIFEDSAGGDVKFYENQSSSSDTIIDIRKFIHVHIEKWAISESNQLHCLVLLNKTMASMNGFANVFSEFSEHIKYDQVNTELLNHDLNKLGNIPRLFISILNVIELANNPRTPLAEFLRIIGSEGQYKISLAEGKCLISELRAIKGETFFEFLDSAFTIYNNDKTSSSYRRLIQSLINLKEMSLKGFEMHIFEALIKNPVEEGLEEDKAKIRSLLNVNIEEYLHWYRFITEKTNSDVVYHTYHSTKGREYKNVIIIMQDDFGRQGKSMFSNFFTKEGAELKKTKNLLYVACSRSIKNLAILYLDDTSKFRDSLEQYFGLIHKFA